MKVAATAAALCFLNLANPVGAQENRSLTNSGLGTPQVITGGVRFTLDSPEGDAPMRERLLLLENTVRQLTQSLANANAEAETYKRQAADLSLRLQALGIPTVEGNDGALEQKLLAAVRSLRLAKKDNEDLKAALIRLSEAVMALLRTVEEIPAESRLALETEMRGSSELLGAPQGAVEVESVEPTLQDAMIVDVREDLSTVAINVGEKHGAKIGMPFQVYRGNESIGTVRVIIVRERVSGAVIQSLKSDKNPVKAGDRLRVDAQRPTQ